MGHVITFFDFNSAQHSLEIPHLPDTCPVCHHASTPVGHFYAYYDTKFHIARILFRCPRLDCQNLFIANYRRLNLNTREVFFIDAVPTTRQLRAFSKTMIELSQEFCEIYNQSLQAETEGLLKICGVGYRKALEFLIKDYLIKSLPQKEKEIKDKFLGKCIEEYIANEQIKTVAKRATWLGNDEAHYLRVWEGKDLQDLKKLIDLTVHWIEMEQLTKEAVKDMPEK